MNTGKTESMTFIRHSLSAISAQQYKDVYDQAIKRIRSNVDDAAAYFVLAKIAADHHNHTKALELFEKASLFAPDNQYCQAYYAQVLTLSGNQIKAKRQADLCAELTVNDDHIADMLGVVYTRTGFHELAVPWFKKAVTLNRNIANYHYNLGASLQFIGDFKGADAAYKACLALDSSNYRALSSLAQLSKQPAGSPLISQLEAHFANNANNADAQLHLGHAIAKCLEDSGDYPKSLDWLRKAKAGKQGATATIDFRGIITGLKALPTDPAKTGADDSPIFIVGLPRTGTTLVDRILGSHSQVYSAGELGLFGNLIKQAANTPSNLTLDSDTVSAAANFNTQTFEQIGREYLALTKELSRGAVRITDKMPLNFLYCGLIHQALPNAKIIALRRNPMDSCLSNYRQLLTTQQAYYAYTYDLLETAKFYCLFDELMTHWTKTLPEDRFIQVHYEDIVFNQLEQTERLLEFCDLGWEDACLNFHENDAPVSTASSVQVRQPLYSGSIGRWQRYGNKLDDLKQYLNKQGIDTYQGMPSKPI
jgi:tetratricopeptide (TPR) repeat protein